MHELELYARRYNSPEYFKTDPIIFPKRFAGLMARGKASLQDVEIAAVIAAHLAWGRRDMIVRDCNRAFDEMGWQPFAYVRRGCYRNEDCSLHRTVKWSEFARICSNLKAFYEENDSLESLSQDEMRTRIYGQKSDPSAANKKINMLRRWMVRNDGIVDLGLWKHTSPAELIIPLDVHVHRVALETGLTKRRQADLKTALEITDGLKKIFPGDPCLGDFALFAYGAERAAGKTSEPVS
ncbi:MAG: TIGR02757 family protein [Bacteroidales bacterium]|nr:TIGR02757 family protein [Bacteroidales bacterium]